MEDGDWPFRIFMLFAFLLLDALLYGFGAALQGLNANHLERAAGEGSSRANRIQMLINHPAEFVKTVQTVTNLVGIMSGAYLLKQLEQLFYVLAGRGLGEQGRLLLAVCFVLSAVCLTAVLISFGILVPKKLGSRHPESWAYGAYPAVMAMVVLLKPFVWLISGLAALVLKPMGIDVNSPEENVTEEDIMLMVTEGHEQGVVEADEAEMITNIFELNDTTAGEIMTHRVNVTALDVKLTLDQAVTFILSEAKNSRFPVYEEDIDNIVGILHMRDALKWAEREENRRKKLSELSGLLREPNFIPETRHINLLFKEMQSQKIHMAIVVDEYGQTAGIVTMEDILEEIVGNILDEYDEEEELISHREDGSVLLDGMTHLEDVAEALQIEFEEEDRENYDTLNGFLISKLDRIPMEGEKPEIFYQGYLFKVLSVENKILHEVAAVKIKSEREADGTEERSGSLENSSDRMA